MSPLAGAWREYVDAGRSFSRPARLFLLAEFALWMGYGIQTVLFNLYLAESGYREAFVGNALRFATREEAEANARDLECRWTLVRATRVVESDDPVNYAFVNGRLVPVETTS